MNQNHLAVLLKKIISLISPNAPTGAFDHQLFSSSIYATKDLKGLIHDLNEVGGKFNLAFLRNEVKPELMNTYIKELEFPLIVFQEINGKINPILIHHENKKQVKALQVQEGQIQEIALADTEPLIRNEKGEVVFISVFTYDSLLSDDSNELRDNHHLTPMQRIMRLFTREKRDIGYIYIYAVIIGIISLSLPLGIQAIIGLISSGSLFNTVIILIAFVLLGILITGVLQIMQLTIVEILQRRIFTKAAFELAFRVPRLKVEAILKQHAPELMNRFFDVLTIQKSLPKLLIDLSAAVLQIFFGLVLLAFYHPFFVFFGITLLLVLIIIFYYTGPKGLSSSIVESKYKYRVAYWLEEIARTINSFKLAGDSFLPMRKTDFFVNNYLKNRKIHFKVLISQLSYVIVFKTLVTGGVLIIGSLLVIDRQITLGQFVASEIIIILILSSVEKIITYMDVVYDMLTAVDKIGHVTDLPLERSGGIKCTTCFAQEKGLHIKTKNLYYRYPEQKEQVLKGIDLDIKAGEKVGFAGFNEAGKSTLMNIMAGIYTGYEGIVTFNNFSIRDLDLVDMRNNIAKNISQEDVFNGTIVDNIAVGKANIQYDEIIKALEKVDLLDEVNNLPEGLNTELIGSGKTFSSTTIHKLILARCIVKNPKILILNDFFQYFKKEEKLSIIKFLTSKENPWTLLTVSNDPLILAECDRIYVLQDGRVINQGTFSKLIELDHFKEIIFSKIDKSLA
ncbi:MAG: peptidase domain-containing ABC transporter [Candidatus Cyclobacteriaceae bacterium M3_2C_046]